jgi:DNA repair protein RadD
MPEIELREYQAELVKLVRSEVAKGYRKIMMVLPTGGGKTFIVADIADRAVNKGHKVLCLMHRRHLVNQMRDRFTDYGITPGIIMAGEEPDFNADVQIGTIQTYHRRLKLAPKDTNNFFIDASVVIIDEAHRSLSKTYQDTLGFYDDKIVIGVTATPCLSSGMGMGQYYDSLVDYVGVGDLIIEGSLVPAIYYAPTKPDLDGLKTVMGDYEKKSLAEKVNTPKIVGDVYTNWASIAPGKQTIVFAVNVKHSKALCNEFVKYGVRAEHLDAHSDDEERSDVLRRLFDGDTQVVCNVGLYTEGFDYPGAECIVLARPTKSMGLYRQMAGRGLRPYPGKKECIIIDHGGCVDRLGYVEDDVVWSLEGKKIAHKKKVVRKKEAHIMTCEMCSHMFTGKQCPKCGYEIKGYGKKIAALDAELVQVKGKKKVYTKKEKKMWFGMLEHYRRSKGYAEGWVYHKYRERFGCWPRGVETGPIDPSDEVVNWITHLNIKWAKSKKREEKLADMNR